MSISDPLTLIAVGCAAISAAILLWYLVRRPALSGGVKFVLLLGLGAFPILTAASGNVAGYQATQKRTFCASCHVMRPWTEDSEDPTSQTLAARHARNNLFGEENCYKCHEDYGELGTLMTKVGGMRHVYMYLFAGYREMTRDEAVGEIHIQKPFPNSNCMQCHSTEGTQWLDVPDHSDQLDEIRRGDVSCASEGCHGPAHPFSHGGTP
jgi:hypothetical protein